jgi:hypothetical protein
LLATFKQFNKEQIWSALELLQSEEKIHISESNQIKWIG